MGVSPKIGRLPIYGAELTGMDSRLEKHIPALDEPRFYRPYP